VSTEATKPRHIVPCLLLVGVCLFPSVIKLARYPDYPGSDDAFIHLAIVESIHRGQGWGINPNEPVFLSTSPLFTAFFSAVRVCTPDVMEIGMSLSAIASALYVLGVFALARRLTGQTAWGMAAATLAATNVHLWRWNGTFMEVTFAMAAVTWLINGFLGIQETAGRRRTVFFFLAGLAMAAAVLLRPELGLLCPAFLAHIALNNRRRLVTDGVALVAGLASVILPVLGALYLVFGHAIPTTATAKTTAGLLWLNLPVWPQMAKVVASGCLGSLIIIGLAGVAITLRPATLRWRKLMTTTIPVWFFPLSGFCFYALKTPTLQSPARYCLPFMATLPVLAAAMGKAVMPVNRRMLLIAWSLCAFQLATALYMNERLIRPVLHRVLPEYVQTMREAAAQIGARAKPGEAVLVFVDIGVVATARPPEVRILDGGGLATPEFQGLSLSAMIRAGHPQFILEGLGTADHFVEQSLREQGLTFRQVWSRRFSSHSIEHAHDIYEARLFQLGESP